MAISARLSRTIHRTLGDEAGEDFINWMGQVEANRSELRELMEAWAARTDGRFVALDARIDQRFDAVDSRFEIMSARIDARFDAMAANFDARFDAMTANVDARVDGMATNFNARFVEQRHWMELRFAESDTRFAKVETRIEERFSDLFKWSIAFWLGGIGAMAALMRLMR